MNALPCILIAALVTLATTTTATASLNDRYPANEYGALEVPEISALASSIAGAPVTAICAPEDPAMDGWTYAYEDPNGRVVVEPVVYLSGEHCGALDKLIHWRENTRWLGRRKHAKLDVWGVSDHLYNASVAIIALVHESMHVRLQSLDEGVVECVAIRNTWPVITRLGLPRWAQSELLLGAQDNHDQLAASYRTVC